MGKNYVLHYDSFNPEADLNNPQVVKDISETHGEDQIFLAVGDDGQARCDLYFHGRPEESFYSDKLERGDDETREKWDEASHAWPVENVTQDRMEVLFGKYLPGGNLLDLFIWRDEDEDD